MQIKKYRNQHQAFVVEGAKSVLELLQSGYGLQHLYITKSFYEEHTALLSKGFKFEIVTETDLVKAGTYASNNAALAVAAMRKLPELKIAASDLVVALDDIRDPGNLGTIIRIADWYGVKTIVCSENCADFYNPKVIAATMGSFTRIQIYYLNLANWLAVHRDTHEIYGASLAGTNIHQMQLSATGIIVMGNEANGIKQEVAAQINRLIKIPAFGQAESLNVATATAIIMDNFRRNNG